MVSKTSVLIITLSFVALSSAYRLVDNFSGSSFFNNFQYSTGADPTHGYVYYASQSQSSSWGYTNVTNNVAYIRSDASTVASGSGRGSVKLTSNKAYTHGLFVFDIAHMPTGCGNWPAIWTVGQNWPNGGEIDVIEGVNKGTKNQMTLHTSAGCNMPTNWNQAGSTIFADCNSASGANGNQGCAVLSSNALSFGTGFNNNKGGVFAMQWETSGIFIWFFPRTGIPADITSGVPNSAVWGTPAASFPFVGTGPGTCASSKFANHQIVIDNTFCGDWAGATFNNDGCSGSCASFVQNNPSAFAQAYWAINSIKVYQ